MCTYAEAEEADMQHHQQTKEQCEAVEHTKNQVTFYVWNEVCIVVALLHTYSFIDYAGNNVEWSARGL